MAHFKKVTSTPPADGLTNAVIMGRKTWESIPSKFRPLPSRTNVILTRSPPSLIQLPQDKEDCTLVASSITDAIQKLDDLPNIGNIFVIGGGEVYKEAMKQNIVNRIFYTEVKGHSKETEDKLDAFFPEVDASNWNKLPFQGLTKCSQNDIYNIQNTPDETGWKMNEKTGLKFRFLDFQRKTPKTDNVLQEEKKEEVPDPILEGPHVNPEEMQYLELCREIIESGVSLIHFLTSLLLFFIANSYLSC